MKNALFYSEYGFILLLIIFVLAITFIRIIFIRKKTTTYGKKLTKSNKIATISINSQKVQKQVLFDFENKQMSILDENSSDITHIDLSLILNVEILINNEPIKINPELSPPKAPVLSTYPKTIQNLSIRLIQKDEPIFVIIPLIISDTKRNSIEFKKCIAVARKICFTILELDKS